MAAYYNENDPFAAAWLRELIQDGLIAPGIVDERSIKDIDAWELLQYEQVHLFAGIGGWSYALRLANWPDDRRVWTGSCPCQPFSAAGKRRGTADERHLWPEFRRLISECEPAIVFGEQVASKDGRLWLAGIRADMEALGYAVGAADLCAAGLGSPHIRQRLWWVADSHGWLSGYGGLQPSGQYGQQQTNGCVGWLAFAEGQQHDGRRHTRRGRRELTNSRGVEHSESEQERLPGRAWQSRSTVDCLDGKTRRIEPSAFPLAHGAPARMVRIRGYGNGIVPQLAAEFIQAYDEVRMGL